MDEILDGAPCGFLSFAEDGKVLLANRTLLGMLGYGSREVVGHHVERLLTVASRIFYQTHWFPLLRLHGHAQEIYLVLRTKDGRDIGTLVNAVRRDRDGREVYDCVLLEVRERQKYEEQLLLARRAAEQARERAEEGQKKLKAANELLEEQAAELELQQEQLQEQAATLEATTAELAALNEELRERNEEAERLREIAEEANEAKSRFLAVMSHELRTPLNAIAGYVEILELGVHGELTDRQREMLSRITRSERHLLRLVNEVLNLARIEAGQVDYQIAPVSVEELVGGVTPLIEPQIEAKGLRFSTVPPLDFEVLADREKAQQILLNLLGNAVKFTPREGEVTVRARHGDDRGHVWIEVTDTGIGIPEDQLDAVFDAFVQVDASRTRESEGSGLGLSISRDLARGMGGDLTVESTLGEGSTFRLRLPQSPAGHGTD